MNVFDDDLIQNVDGLNSLTLQRAEEERQQMNDFLAALRDLYAKFPRASQEYESDYAALAAKVGELQQVAQKSALDYIVLFGELQTMSDRRAEAEGLAESRRVEIERLRQRIIDLEFEGEIAEYALKRELAETRTLLQRVNAEVLDVPLAKPGTDRVSDLVCEIRTFLAKDNGDKAQ